MVIIYLDLIFIDIKVSNKVYINIIWYIVDISNKYSLFANLKKYKFYKNKFCFLGNLVLAYKIKIENKKIKVIKNKPELKFVIHI